MSTYYFLYKLQENYIHIMIVAYWLHSLVFIENFTKLKISLLILSVLDDFYEYVKRFQTFINQCPSFTNLINCVSKLFLTSTSFHYPLPFA